MSDPFFDDFLSQSPAPKSFSSREPPSSDDIRRQKQIDRHVDCATVAVPHGTDPLSLVDTDSTLQTSAARSESTTTPLPTPGASSSTRGSASLSQSAKQQPPPPPQRPVQIVAFRAHPPVQGNEMLKPLTYFPIDVTIQMPPPDHELFQRFVPFPTPPYQRSTAAVVGLRRNRWDGDATTEIKRRYSELADIRQLLVLQYPMLIIPPLPPKSANDNFNTYLQSQAQLQQQTRNINRFLRELAKIPEVMLFHELVPNLFQYPREKLSDLMSRVREMISTLRHGNASLEEHREYRSAVNSGSSENGGGGATAVAVETVTHLAVEGQKMMRGFVGALSSWMATPATGSAAQAAKDRESISQKVSATYQDDPDVKYWNAILDRTEHERVVLSQVAEALLKLIVADDEMYATLEDVSKALSEYSDILSGAEPFSDISEASRRCATLVFDVSDLHKTVGDRRYITQYEVLLFEVSYLEAVEDTISFHKCLIRRKLETDLDPFIKPQEKGQLRQYVAFVDERLRVEYSHFTANHKRRMKSVAKHMCELPLSVFSDELRRSSVHPFVALMNTESYSRFQ
eukprot:CAMPEP_0176424744 /NCGR_PEP_ID=MMETSP0127-20121128/11008_1 /TAXON_ID=938130 /ORGANISM="Platyophrya macrostoma, Strain WH" /LENGTH=570 /DNA_ID=CAMNT_0017805837 /DNA_START=47 /DNA_END=1759 /DNA_ORIENTATION=+